VTDVSTDAATELDPYDLQWFRYLLFGRAVPAAVFGLIAWLQVSTRLIPTMQRAVAHPDVDTVARAVQVLVFLLFAAIPVVIYVTRPAPTAGDRSMPARLAAFLGTFLLLMLPFLGVAAGPALYESKAVGATIGAALTVAAWLFAVVTLLFLRHNLSVTPEARSLVTAGPYRWIRHPLYLAEIVAAVGGIFGGIRVGSLIALALFAALQVARAFYEERLLRSVFPEYDQYAAHTKRILPAIW